MKNKRNLVIVGAAVLILIVVFLIINLSTFSVPGITGPPCFGASGYYCTNQIYEHSTGNIIVTLRQITGINWTTANFIFVPQGTPYSNDLFSSGVSNSLYGTIGKGLPTSKPIPTSTPNIRVSLPATGAVAIGTIAEGAIYAQYTTSPEGPVQYTYMASIYVKAT
jgi:hypothetical protein